MFLSNFKCVDISKPKDRPEIESKMAIDYKWKKRRWCAWDLNPGRQDESCWRIHWVMAGLIYLLLLNRNNENEAKDETILMQKTPTTKKGVRSLWAPPRWTGIGSQRLSSAPTQNICEIHGFHQVRVSISLAGYQTTDQRWKKEMWGPCECHVCPPNSPGRSAAKPRAFK